MTALISPRGRAKTRGSPRAVAAAKGGGRPSTAAADLRGSARRRALELTQHGVATGDGFVKGSLGRLLARQRCFDLLGPDVTQLHHVAEPQAARVLGRLLVSELKQRRFKVGVLLVEA